MDTTKKNPKFVDVVKANVEMNSLTNAQSEIFTIAFKLDDLQERLTQNAIYMSEKFAHFAKDAADGRIYGDSPSGYSTLNDIVADSARFASLKEMFLPFFQTVVGKKFQDAVKATGGEV